MTTLDAAVTKERDEDAESILRLIKTVRYMTGIAERGEGKPCPDDVLPERFLLEYVIKLEGMEAELAASQAREQQLRGAIEQCIDWANNREEEWGDRAVNAFAFLYQALALPSDTSALDALVKEAARLNRVAFLVGNIFVHGGFKAETYNERELEKLLRENGTFWESIADFDAAMNEVKE
jgi:hypothetical protein